MIRQRTLDKCEEQFTSELNIDKLLKKVRDSHAMVTNLPQAQDFRPYLIYNKTNVVQLTDSGDESETIEEKIDVEVHDVENEHAKGHSHVFIGECMEHNYFNDTGNSSRFDQSMEDSRYQNDYVLAIKRSLVQGMPFNKKEKIELMEFQDRKKKNEKF